MSDDERDPEEEEEEEEDQDLTNSDVVTKYKAAADITNKCLVTLLPKLVPGAKLIDLCKTVDDMMNAELAAIFKGKKLEKGIAFPCCLSLNNVVGHYCPADDDTVTLKAGDVAKVDFGCHIDGYIATQAHTHVVSDSAADGATPVPPVTGRVADAVACAQTCFDAAVRLIRPGKKTDEVDKVLAKIAEVYGCQIVEGVMTHQMKRFVIDGNKVIPNKPATDQRVDSQEIEAGEVYAVDIVVSTGEGHSRMIDERQTTVYKRALDMEYKLKMKAARAVFSDINKRFPALPFTTRYLEPPEGKASLIKLGMKELLDHELLYAYPVLYDKAEKDGECHVVQVKGTILLMPSGWSDRVTKVPPEMVAEAKSDKKVEDQEILDILATSIDNPKKKKDKKKKK